MLHIITPVKDSLDTTLATIESVMTSRISEPFTYTIYDDFSSEKTARRLDDEAARRGLRVVHLRDVTDHPSPNYLMVLRTARREALAAGASLCIVESDVTVRPDTLQSLADGAAQRPDCGIAAAVTVDESGAVNYPYLHARGQENRVFATRKHCSFCCSLLTPELLRRFDFDTLNPEKNWYDVTISHESVNCGLQNYLFTSLPVLHRPHQSRPWKQLKYKNPILYYWKKFTKGLDKI